MANTTKDKGTTTGPTSKEDKGKNMGKNMGNKMAEAAKKPDDRNKSSAAVAGIREHMDVIASCGTKIGVVDRVEGKAIKLTRNDSPDGQHHFIPTDWVGQVDSHVHLKKNSEETEQGWKSDAASCGC